MLTFEFPHFPILTTDRLILRKVITTDAESVYKLRNDPKTVEYTARPPYQNIQEAIAMVDKMEESYLQSEGISWAITLKNSDTMIGGIGFWRLIREHYRAEIGYSLLFPFWNQGIMSEALAVVLDFGFNQMGIHSVEANLNPNNLPSERILLKSGFVKEGYFRENYYFNGRFDDTLTYGKVKPK
jgi:[ribosomal protein S5]-alanine N-acetyltransferase